MPSKKKAVKMYLTDAEHQDLISRAASSRLSMSTYAKRVCFGYRVTSKLDTQGVLNLLRIKGELGKIGGLIKYALVEQNIERTKDLQIFLEQIDVLKMDLTGIINQLKALNYERN